MKHPLKTNSDLLLAQQLAYNPLDLVIENLAYEAESKEYGACTFTLNGKKIIFRTAKITPTKVGQFVTFWKRMGTGPIMPYDVADPFDLFMVSVRTEQYSGQFIFPKEILLLKGVLSKDGHGGKRAIRVYPPWDTADNAQARKAQAGQVEYFAEISPDINIERIKNLLD